MNKVFITGNNGQLGRELERQLRSRDVEFVGYDIPEIDIADYESTRELIFHEDPDIIINCAAMTNVDGCETDLETAERANAVGPRVLAEIAREKDIPIVQVSTDYVFDGHGIKEGDSLRPYLESDQTAPQSAYGRTKLAGEENVMALTDKYYIVRTAWLYGDGHNFVKTMLGLAEKYPQVTVVDDQVGSPTSTVDLARAILDLIETGEYGIYHATNEGSCSWAEFAQAIFKNAGKDTEVIPVTTEEYAASAGKTVAERPTYSVLENEGLERLGINTFRDWEDSLIEYLENNT